jgi:clan AA aspartic protease
MGIFTVEVGIGRLFGGPMTLVQAMVDTGAFNSMMPASLLTQLGVTPNDRRKYALADNSEVEYDIGMARIGIDWIEWHCPVIFGPEGQHLLGATTLEIFGLMVDPVAGELVPREIRARPF